MDFARAAYLTSVHPPAYPICPWRRLEAGVQIDWTVMGTAFFVSGEIFVTAAHVVEDYLLDDSPLRVLFIDKARGQMVPIKTHEIVRHPSLDIAIGLASLPEGRMPKPFVLGDGALGAGERVSTFGYSGTDVEEREGILPGTRGITVDWYPAFHEGEVDAFHPGGFGLMKGLPVYVHTAETLGGASGGPMLRQADSAVYGVTCTGSKGYGTAIDVRAFLDWPISFLQGRTLRRLATEGLVSLRGK